MGKGPFASGGSSTFRRHNRVAEMPQQATAESSLGTVAKAKKKTLGARLWMKFDRSGRSELVELDRNAVIRWAGIPARDLRILGPVFCHTSNIFAREKAMVVSLEFVKAIVTAEEVLLHNPLCREVIPFVEQLKHQLPYKSQPKLQGLADEEEKEKESEMQISISTQRLPVREPTEELPFEFQVLEIALEVVCSYMDSSVADLERVAYPVLDELARSVSTMNLQNVRSLKSNLTRWLVRVQKVRDEIEHLLDDNEDMAQLYLTRKWMQIQQCEATSGPTTLVAAHRQLSCRSGSLLISGDDNDVEDLEMLLEAYFMQLDGTRNKILSVREYIDDTEDYVNIQLDNQRNELIQLQLILIFASFAIAVNTLIASAFGMNLPCSWYKATDLFWVLVFCSSGACSLVFILMLVYARWKKWLGS